MHAGFLALITCKLNVKMLLSKCIFFFFVLTELKSCLAAPVDNDSCAFDFTMDFPDHPPLILNNDDKDLVIPVKDVNFEGVVLKKGDKVLLACAGGDNSFNDTTINNGNSIPSAVAQCIGKDILSANSKNFKFESFGCKSRTHAEILPVGSSCAGGKAKLYEIGFNVTTSTTSSFWFPLITTCFDPTKSVTYYSRHSISGKGLVAEEFGNRPSFNVGLKEELYPDFSPERVYTKVQQLETFSTILASEELAQAVLNSGEYLDRGHLAPDGDFFFKVTADATYFYINVAPQWHVINSGVWSELEIKVRDLAKNTQLDYEIHTGTHGLLKYENLNQDSQLLYLYYDALKLKQELPVPQFFWKIVVSPANNTGIAFISVNDNLYPENAESPCESICEAADWDVNDIICCTIDDLMNAFQDDIPKFNISQTLHGLGSASHLSYLSSTLMTFLLYVQRMLF